MNTNKVFTAFNENGKEILLYRKDNNTYIELNGIEDKIYPKEYIDLETLRYLSETLKICKHMPAFLIKKLYNIDREKTMKTKDILYGIKGIIKDLKETKNESGLYLHGLPVYDYHYEWKIDKQELGLYIFEEEITIDSCYKLKIYKNLKDGKRYFGFNKGTKGISQLKDFDNGFEYVCIGDITLKDNIKETIIEKKKIYEYANEIEKEKI